MTQHSNTVTYRWVLKRYRFNDEQGKRALISQTYILINKERGKTDDIIVAFKWVDFNGKRPLPEGCQYASEEQDKRLEEIDKQRRNAP
jgi:acyl-ACP thioesterase